MEDTLARMVNDFFARLDGPLHFRIILQPTMAVIFAIRDGLRDAREGQPAFLWSLFSEPTLRRARLQSGWKSVSKIFILAIVLDATYQVIAIRWFYPFETLLVAVLLALVPYLLIRGPVNRIKKNLHRPEASSARKSSEPKY